MEAQEIQQGTEVPSTASVTQLVEVPSTVSGGLTLLPPELARRCLRPVAIATLFGRVRLVSKHFRSLVLSEAHERTRVLLHDALLAGVAHSAGSDGIDTALRQHTSEISIALEAELAVLASRAPNDSGVRLYTSTCRSLCFNLADPKNPQLRARLLDGQLTPDALVKLPTHAMASSSLQVAREEWHGKRKWSVTSAAPSTEGLYRCEMCLRLGTCGAECRGRNR